MLLKNGYQTLISFSLNPSVSFEEKSVTPPGIDGGDPVDTTTMRNEQVRTKGPRTLIDMTDGSLVVAYDPIFYEEALDMININQQIIVTEPDGSSVMFWGWLRTFTINEHTEGEQPTANCSFTVSNEDDSGNEVVPDYTAPA